MRRRVPTRDWVDTQFWTAVRLILWLYVAMLVGLVLDAYLFPDGGVAAGIVFALPVAPVAAYVWRVFPRADDDA